MKNREIKFRAWDIHNKLWLYEGDESSYGEFRCIYGKVKWITGSEVIIFDGDVYDTYHTEFKIVQYIGLKDKNGKEIYEGDILEQVIPIIREMEFDVEINGVEERRKFKTETFSEGYIVCDMTPGFNLDFANKTEMGEKIDHFEIIGNIYEHKHLLNGKQKDRD